MPVYEIDLMAELAREIGDTDSTNLYASANELFSALNDGLKDYNLNCHQKFEIIGTGDTAYYNPTPSDEQKRLVVLYSSKRILKSDLAKFARQAVIHTNPTGKTDLTQRAEYTKQALVEKDKEIKQLVSLINRRLVDAELADGKGSMELKSDLPQSPEGLSIITFDETK